MKKSPVDPVMNKVLKIFKDSEKSLDQLGQEMGYTGDVARKAVWQFLNKVSDPRISTLRRFAAAMGVPIEELVQEKRKGE